MLNQSSRREFLKRASALGLSATAMSQLLAHSESGSQKNIVVLMLDALRPDYTQAYGSERATSPFLAKLAKESVVFDRAYSTSTWTAPACASFFTGHYPPAHGIVEGMQAHSRRAAHEEDKSKSEGKNATEEKVYVNAFAPDMKLLTEYLQLGGYQCFGLSTNPNVGPEIGFDRGFDRLVNMDNATAEEVVDEVSAWQDELAETDRPYFLYLHFMDTHMPYNQRAPWYQTATSERSEAEEAAELYRSEIGYLDSHLEKLFQQWGWGEETLVILVSDHGEELGDHGKIGHRFQMQVELNRIVMMARGGGLKTVGKRVSDLVGIHDWLSSLLDWGGMQPPSEGSGISLLPLLAQPNSDEVPAGLKNRILFAHRRGTKAKQGDIWAVNHQEYRLLQSSAEQRVLYALEKDPMERRNVSPRKHSDYFGPMTAALDQHLALGFTDRAIKKLTSQTDADRALLEDLGYVGD